jgi:hypothetical protein
VAEEGRYPESYEHCWNLWLDQIAELDDPVVVDLVEDEEVRLFAHRMFWYGWIAGVGVAAHAVTRHLPSTNHED